MLIYNIFIFIVAFLLYLDYVVHKNDIHLVQGANRLSFGNSFIYLALGVIIFFAGFRFEIGYDYPKYIAGYLHDSELGKWEPIFNFFVRLSRELNFGLESQAMFLFFSIVTILLVYKALLRLTSHYRLGILLYLLVPALYVNSFSVIRQGIAMAVLLYGLQYITQKVDYKKYAIVAFFAFMFHYSSLFVVLIYILGGRFFQRTHSWVMYSFFIFGSFFLSFAHIGKIVLASLPGHFSQYANYEMDVSPLKLLVINVFFLFFMIQKDHFIKSRLERYLFNSIFIGLLIFNVFSDFVYVSRLAQYFLIAEIVLVPIYLYSLKDAVMRKVLLVLFLIYYLFNFNYALYRDEHLPGDRAHFLIPYENYFYEEKKSNRNLNIEAWYNYISESTEKEEKE